MKMKKTTQRATAALCISMISTGPAYAMPSYKKNSGQVLSKLQTAAATKPELHGAQFFEDHNKNVKTIYVSPATRKTETGLYTNVGVTPQCNKLEELYKLTYLLPANNWGVAARAPFSPIFDMGYGINARNEPLLQKIADKAGAADEIVRTQQAKYKAYLEAKELHEQAKADVESANAAIAALNADVTAAGQLVTLATFETVEAARAVLAEAIRQRDEQLPDARARLSAAIQAELPLRQPYAAAYAAWKPFEVNLAQLTEQRVAIEGAVEAMQALAMDSFNYAESTLNKFEQAQTGKATAGYTLFDKEVGAANTALGSGRNGYSLVQLPMVNVRLAPKGNRINATSTGAPNMTGNVALDKSATPEASKVLGLAKATPSVFKDATTGKPVNFVERTPSVNEGAGTYSTVVTRGAFCTGDSVRTEKVRTENLTTLGTNRPIAIKYSDYKPKGGTVLAQAVALNYEYYVKSDPVGVKCTLDVEKTTKSIQSGKKKRFLFWSKDTRKTVIDQNVESGLSCTITSAPTAGDPNPEAQAQRLEDLRTKMASEMLAQYILANAKSYEVYTLSPTGDVVQKPSEGLAKAGTALGTICGNTNTYCAIGSIVLKSAEELIGFQNGSREANAHMKTKLTRDFTENAYHLANGSAVINLQVKL
jgi:hypothetical protein